MRFITHDIVIDISAHIVTFDKNTISLNTGQVLNVSDGCLGLPGVRCTEQRHTVVEWRPLSWQPCCVTNASSLRIQQKHVRTNKVAGKSVVAV